MSIFAALGTRAHFDALMAHNQRALRGEAPMPPQTPEAIARHEGSHAVVGIRLGGEFDEIVVGTRRTTSTRNPISLGHGTVRFRGGTVDRPVAVLWAGPLGDGHVFSSGADLDAIRALTGKLEYSRGFAVAAQLVDRHRALIERVAARLLEVGRLSHAEVVELLGGASTAATTSR